jgi:tripeptide aminopeptidase
MRLAVAALIALWSLLFPQESPDARAKRVANDPRVASAMAAIDRDHERLVGEIIQLTQIPAPPFKEDTRGAAYLDMLRASGLTAVERDDIGNVMGIRRGTAKAGGPVLAVVAHMDTVFPEGTDVTVKRQGTKLLAPGVADNTRSLAVLLAMIRAMDEARIQTTTDILFVGNVGEEGLGDLRGTKFLLQKGKYKDRIKQFLAVDGAGTGEHISNGAVGSKRYRVAFKGPGGHSYSDFGLVNPAFAMGAAMQKLGAITVPRSPKTTFSVGVIGGGTSVNSIPFETWMEVDMRSESPVELEKLETQFLTIMKQAAADENRARRTTTGSVVADIKMIGDRPPGVTAETTDIARTAAATVRALGMTPVFEYSSTDANFPISLGIPALRLNSGGIDGQPHSLDEWTDVEKTASLKGIRALMVTLLSLAGLK